MTTATDNAEPKAEPTRQEKADRVKVQPPAGVREAAREQREAAELDGQLRKWARIATDSMARVAALIREAKDKEIWKLVADADGNPFPTWQSYIADVCGREMEPLAAVNRNALVKMLLSEGLSQRAVAQAVNTSPATVNDIAKGKAPGEKPAEKRNRGGAPAGQPVQRANPADRAYDAVDRVIRRAQSFPDDLPIQDVERLIPKLREAVKVLGQVVKTYNAAVTEAQKRHPAGGKKPNTAA